MDLKVKLYLERSENELVFAEASFRLSIDDNVKEIMKVPKDKTFFNNVISQAYYAIFYSAKAYLLSKGIETKSPEEHRKTYEEFRKIVRSDQLDKELLEIYDDAVIKADNLLGIFKKEKWKRGHFTYHINANANIPIAKNSIENARKFLVHLTKILEFYESEDQDEKDGN